MPKAIQLSGEKTLNDNTGFLTAIFKFLRHSQRLRTFLEDYFKDVTFLSMNPRFLQLYTAFFLSQLLQKIHLTPLIFTVSIDGELDVSCNTYNVGSAEHKDEQDPLKPPLQFNPIFHVPSTDTPRDQPLHIGFSLTVLKSTFHTKSAQIHNFSLLCLKTLFFPFPIFLFTLLPLFHMDLKPCYVSLPNLPSCHCTNIRVSSFFPQAILHSIILTKVHSYFKRQAKSHSSNRPSFMPALTLDICLFIT